LPVVRVDVKVEVRVRVRVRVGGMRFAFTETNNLSFV
jgi:hypothetical protein